MKLWTQTEIKLLKKLYGNTPNAELIRKLGKSKDSICKKAGELNLLKSDAVKKDVIRRLWQGHTPSSERLAWLKLRRVKIIETYQNLYTKILVECTRCTHQWKTTIRSVTRTSGGCPKCARAGAASTQRFDITDLRRLLKGTSIKIDYRTWKGTEHSFTCVCTKCKNTWTENRKHFFENPRCPRCTPTRWNTDLIKSKLQKCNPDIIILGRYHKYLSPLKCKCKLCSHTWYPTWACLLQGSSCPKCTGHIRLSTQEVSRRLKQLNHELKLINVVKRKGSYLVTCQCTKCEQRFRSMWTALSKCAKCPMCFPSDSALELAVRSTVEKLTKRKFPRVRLAELKGFGAQPLEIDCYNADLRLGVEAQGPQHYEFIKKFHPNGISDFRAQQRRDWRKRYQCWYHNIKLIRVPYWVKDVEQYLKKKLNKSIGATCFVL